MTERRKIDPNKVIWHHSDLNAKAVAHYERHPNKPFDSASGTPYIEVGKDGRMYGGNGRHRAQAAINKGRKLDAIVVSNPARTAAFSSGCMVMTLGLVGMAVVGLARMLRSGR